MEKAKSHESEISVEERLRALYGLQLVDSEIDKIKTLRGELPLEVQDLEDEIVGLETRLGNLKDEVTNLEKSVVKKNNEIVEAEALIKKYEEQQKNVRNNREFDSLSKEIEYQNLEIELFNKKIKEFNFLIEEKNLVIADSEATLADRKGDLDNKKSELDEIISDTQKEEEGLYKKSEKVEAIIEISFPQEARTDDHICFLFFYFPEKNRKIPGIMLTISVTTLTFGICTYPFASASGFPGS